MTDDIVAKLRGGFFLRNEAADEIERNRAAIAELLDALMSVCWIDGRIEADMPAIDAAITKHIQPTTKGSN